MSTSTSCADAEEENWSILQVAITDAGEEIKLEDLKPPSRKEIALLMANLPKQKRSSPKKKGKAA